MTFLLQYFIDHQCLSRYQIMHWYKNKELDDYEGFDVMKQLTVPFLKSLLTSNTGKFVIKKNYYD